VGTVAGAQPLHSRGAQRPPPGQKPPPSSHLPTCKTGTATIPAPRLAAEAGWERRSQTSPQSLTISWRTAAGRGLAAAPQPPQSLPSPKGTPEVLLPSHPSPGLLRGPELDLFTLPRIPQPAASQPRAGHAKDDVFQPRCSTGCHTTLLNVHPCAAAEQSAEELPRLQRDGCLFWQGDGGSARTISLADSRDQWSHPSGPGVLLRCHQRAGLVKQTLQELVLR